MARRDFGATSGAERPRRIALLGLLVVPLLVGGVLAWALATPAHSVDRITAAIVNDDEPVTVNGQTVPLGRQFAAGLMAAQEPPQPSASPAADAPTSSLTWVLTNADDAAAGLAAGRYSAVVTIPNSFSADATSYSGPAAQARQATFRVQTTPASAWLDPAITAVVTQQAASALNRQLIGSYLDSVYQGFNTIDEQIGQAATGAEQLAGGAAETATGAAQVSDGATDLAAGLTRVAAGAADVADGLATLAAKSARLPGATADLAKGSVAVSAGVDEAADRIDRATVKLAALVDVLCQTPGPLCDRADAALAELTRADEKMTALKVGAKGVKDGNAALAKLMPPIVDGIDGAATGSAAVSSGAADSSSGADTLADGAKQVADGTAQVDDGAAQLASGLGDASAQIPTYSDSDIATLSTVVAQPVTVDQDAVGPGLQSAPLFAALALWIGGFAIALAYQPVPPRRLLTGAASLRIAGSAVLPGVVLGAAQGLVVATAVLGSVSVTPLEWAAFAASAVFAGAVFALANLGLAAAFGGAGRLVAIAIGLVSLAAGLSGTVPPVIASLAAPLPTTHGLHLLQSTLTGDAGTAAAAMALLAITAIVAFALVYAGVTARRRVPLRAIAD